MRLTWATLAISVAVGVLATAESLCLNCFVTRTWSVPATGAAPEALPELDTSTGSREASRLHDLPNIGVAFSGGGTRSATATAGQLRGLLQNGWLEHVRYISAVSGGAWAAIPFTYTRRPLNAFLGRATTPGELRVPGVATTADGDLPAAITRSSLTQGTLREGLLRAVQSRDGLGNRFGFLFNKGFRDALRPNKTYARILGEVFIDPLIDPGNQTSNRLFTWDASSEADIQDLNGRRLGPFLTARAGQPYLLVGASLVSHRRDYAFPLVMPVEYTPLYSGVRTRFAGLYGGGYVSPWAYDPTALAPADWVRAQQLGAGTVGIRLDRDRRFTLADVAASTGAAPALAAVIGGPVTLPPRARATLQRAAGLFPAFRHVGLRDGHATLTGEMPHADGGALDNLGVMPLLARGVTNLLVFVNTSTQTFEDNLDLRSLFGASAEPSGTSGVRGRNAVFPASRWDRVELALREARERGGAQVYCDTGWEVLPNDFYGIGGYTGLSICIFYNAAVPDWERGLNLGVMQLLKEKPRGTPLTDEAQEKERWLPSKNRFGFPWFSTFEQDKGHVIRLRPVEVNLLSNLSAWVVTNPSVVKQVRQAIRTLPAPAPKPTP